MVFNIMPYYCDNWIPYSYIWNYYKILKEIYYVS